jgi:acyl-CoA hydrolase
MPDKKKKVNCCAVLHFMKVDKENKEKENFKRLVTRVSDGRRRYNKAEYRRQVRAGEYKGITFF